MAKTSSWSALWPNRSTGMTPRGFRPNRLAVAMPRLNEAASILKVASSTSTNTGVAPTSATASPVAQKVKDGHSTASPRPTPLAISTMTSASVPLAQVTTCLAPQKAASAASSAVTSGPLMNWQCASTRATASSTAGPSRRRWLATSMKGILSVRSCWFMEPAGSRALRRLGGGQKLADDATRSLAGRRASRGPRRIFQAADRDFETGDALVAGHRRHLAAHGAQEGDQFGAQRFVMADREMAHRIAAVGFEAETFGDLTREQVAHHVFAACRHRDVAGLERRQPVGIDVGEHARGGSKLQQRDILALGDRAGELRLHFDNVGFGEPADQVDVVDGEIDHHADIRHARRKRSDAGDADRQNIFTGNRLLDGGDRRIEPLDMPDHQSDAGAARGGHDLPPLLDRGRDRLLDQDMNVAGNAGQRDLVMKMRGGCDRHGIDALGEQIVEICKSAAADELSGACAMFGQGVDDAAKRCVRQPRQHAGMIGAHDASADYADAKCRLRISLRLRISVVMRRDHFCNHVTGPQIRRIRFNPQKHTFTLPARHCQKIAPPKRDLRRGSLARRHRCGEWPEVDSKHVLIQTITC